MEKTAAQEADEILRKMADYFAKQYAAEAEWLLAEETERDTGGNYGKQEYAGKTDVEP